MKHFAITVAVVAILAALSSSVSALNPVTVINDIKIQTYDGFTLHADCVVPNGIATPATPNFLLAFQSFAAQIPQEYIGKLTEYAKEGYVCCQYQARGWFNSTGKCSVVGPEDQKDISTVITALTKMGADKKWPLNASSVASLGISMGAGLALMSAGVDERVGVVISMSGWAHLIHTLYDRESPAIAYGNLLMDMIREVGKPTQQLFQVWNDMLYRHNVSQLTAFCAERSPGSHLAALNARKVKIFMSQNYLDRLFRPNRQIEFWNSLDVPKFLLLNEGLHAQPESRGLPDGKEDYIWRHAKRWLDHWMKGIPTGITELPPVHAQVVHTSEYKMFNGWPDPEATEMAKYAVGPRSGAGDKDPYWGTLVPQGPQPVSKTSLQKKKTELEAPPKPLSNLKAKSSAAQVYKNTISFSTDPGVWSGLPVVGDFMYADFNVSIEADMYLVPQKTAIVYMSPKLELETTLCGAATFNVPTTSSVRQWQWYGFLYDVDPATMVGKLIADSFWTCWDNCPRPHQDLLFRFICRRIAEGHRLAVGIALYDNLYQPANNATALEVDLKATGNFKDSYFTFPVAMN